MAQQIAYIALSQLLFYLWQAWLIILTVSTLLIVLYIVALVLIAKRYRRCIVLNAYSMPCVESSWYHGYSGLACGSCSHRIRLSSIPRR